jgi:excisionase family DNA binding protein
MIPRMRLAREVVEELKKLDPGTSVTESGIRRLVKEGKLRSVKVGNKSLINLDQCIAYFNEPLIIIEPVPEAATSLIKLDRMEQFRKNIGMR